MDFSHRHCFQGLLLRYGVSDCVRALVFVEAGVEGTAFMSRVQALEARGAGATTSTALRLGNKEAMEYKPHVWSGEKNIEMELQSWVGALHDNNAEGRRDCGIERRVYWRNWKSRTQQCHKRQWTDVKDMERILWEVLIACTKIVSQSGLALTRLKTLQNARIHHASAGTGSSSSWA